MLKICNRGISHIMSMLCSAVVAAAISPSHAAKPQPTPENFHATVADVMATWNTPGLAVAVITRDHGSFAKGYGLRQWDRDVPVTKETAFGLASITKTFNAVAIGTLIDDGLVGLDDKIVSHLPSFQVADPWIARNITIRDLLSHRSGFESYDDVFEQFGDMTPAEVMAQMKNAGQSIPFRGGFEYNNIGYTILGELIHIKTGQPWDTYVTDRILKPLGMRSSYASPRDFMKGNALFTSGDGWLDAIPRGLATVRKNIAIPHAMWPKRAENLELAPREGENRHIHIHVTGIDPSQSVFASAQDMSVWAEMLLNDGAANGVRILSKKTAKELRALTTPISPESLFDDPTQKTTNRSFESVGYAPGFEIITYGGETCFGHDGDELGYEAGVAICPKAGVAVFAAVNNRLHLLGSRDVIIQTVLDWHMDLPPVNWNKRIFAQSLEDQAAASAYAQQLRKAVAAAGNISIESSDFVGEYVHPAAGRLTIESTSNGLIARLSDEAGWKLSPFKGDALAAEWTGPRAFMSLFNFSRDETGKAVSVSVPDFSLTYKRREESTTHVD